MIILKEYDETYEEAYDKLYKENQEKGEKEMNEEVNINLLLDRLYTTGKIDKRYMWALKDYITNLQEENEKLKYIIKEAINYIDDNTYYKDHKGHINIDDVYIILQGEDKDDTNSG